MASPSRDVGASLRESYARLSRFPGGRTLFSRLVGIMAPYTATTRATVAALEPGHATIVMRDRRRVRNHLRSVHAMALANLAEEATGLAFVASLPPGTRAILTGFSIEYLKKARGTLTATCRCPPPDTGEKREYEMLGEIHDASGVLVARARARWLAGPEPSSGAR